MSNFVEVTFSQNEQELAEQAIERLVTLMEEKGYSEWSYSEADLEIILIGILAGMALTAAQIASVVPNAIFRQFGTQLLKVSYNEGTYAIGKTKWTVVPSGAIRSIPAGTQIEIGGLGFAVQTETEVPASSSSVTLQVVALERGEEYNKQSGLAAQVNPLDWVLEVQLVGETYEGTNEENDEEYLIRLADTLALQAPRPITAEDYADFLLNAPESIAGVKVGRATSIDGYNGAENEFEGKIELGHLTEVKEVTSFTGITKGTELKDAGGVIPSGTTVESFNVSSKIIVMSASATAEHAKEKIKAIGSYENQRYVTTFVTNSKGEALTTEQMEILEHWLKGGEFKGIKYPGYREINFQCPVEAPQYNKISLICEVKVLPEYTKETVKVSVEEALRKFISPATWGNPSVTTSGDVTWLNYVNGEKLYSPIRYNQVIGVIEAVPGVGYVVSGSTGLKIGLETKPPTGTSDVYMYGAAPLPKLYTEQEVVTEGGKTKGEYEEYFSVKVK